MKRTRKFSRKRFCMLTVAILAGLSAATSVAAAEAVSVEHVRYNGRDFADITFFKQYVGLGDEKKMVRNPGDLYVVGQTDECDGGQHVLLGRPIWRRSGKYGAMADICHDEQWSERQRATEIPALRRRADYGV